MHGSKLLKVLLMTVGCLLPAGMAKADLLGFYTFNGNVNDTSGNGNNGTINGSVSFTDSGPFGGSALTLDGTSKANYVTVPINTAIELTANETFGAWLLVPTSAPTSSIRGAISSDNGDFDPTLDVDTRNGGFQYSAFVGGNVVGNGTANTGVWTFVAVSYSGGANGHYIFQVGSNQMTGTTNFDGGGVENITYIGINPNFDFEFQGGIADAFFYNTALSASQLANIGSTGPSAILPGVPEPSMSWLLGGTLLLLIAIRRKITRQAQSL